MERETPPKEVLTQQRISALTKFRDEYNPSIPDFTIHSTTRLDGSKETPKYKVRHAWFTEVVAELDRILMYDLIDDQELINKIKKYQNSVCNFDFAARPTTKDDIDAADAIITETINWLKK